MMTIDHHSDRNERILILSNFDIVEFDASTPSNVDFTFWIFDFDVENHKVSLA